MEFLPKGRLDAFADGVFAIVITLLVLDLAIPDVVEGIMVDVSERTDEIDAERSGDPLWPGPAGSIGDDECYHEIRD